MSALAFSFLIGFLIGLTSRMLFWIFGSIAVTTTVLLAIASQNASPEALGIAAMSILGYNFGLISALSSMLFRKQIA